MADGTITNLAVCRVEADRTKQRLRWARQKLVEAQSTDDEFEMRSAYEEYTAAVSENRYSAAALKNANRIRRASKNVESAIRRTEAAQRQQKALRKAVRKMPNHKRVIKVAAKAQHDMYRMEQATEAHSMMMETLDDMMVVDEDADVDVGPDELRLRIARELGQNVELAQDEVHADLRDRLNGIEFPVASAPIKVDVGVMERKSPR